jgi:small subunit ribosomal protein S7
MPEFDTPLLFDRWDLSDTTVEDDGLERYINLEPVIAANTGGRHADEDFGSRKVNVVERVVNQLMRTEDYTGKKHSAYNVMKDALEEVHETLEINPVQALVDAIENSSPREEVTRLRYGGISVPKTVDTAPARRVDIAIRNITSGSVNASRGSEQSIEECVAEEIIQASQNDQRSYAVNRKNEIERVAASAR